MGGECASMGLHDCNFTGGCEVDMSDELANRANNRLAGQTSPYLLQHAQNPVDWYPWGEEAFEAARHENKPIFLSVGYSTCYWCHVMEREVFENEKIAALMNRVCINIKVDREERPDVDDLYMTAVQMIAGQGGWPMSVFLTPPHVSHISQGSPGEPVPGEVESVGNSQAVAGGLKPFFAGTYFPPSDMHGRPGFVTVLQNIEKLWANQRDDVVSQANRVADAIAEHYAVGTDDKPIVLDGVTVDDALRDMMGRYDAEDGGFGGAPKFPQSANLDLLLAGYENRPTDVMWKAISHTLDRMARGGMYDQIGGGFHRYSTDGQWLVPHFEKMLYDNGQLVNTYLTAHAIRPREDDKKFYERVVRETCDYVLREMVDGNNGDGQSERGKNSEGESVGGFWSAQDAEVDAREGGNYVWLPDQVRVVIEDKVMGERACEMYGLDRGTNFQDPHHRDEPAMNVMYLPKSLAELGRAWSMDVNEVAALRMAINAKLLAARDRRPQPMTDDKVLAGWNGMMIAGMARAGRMLDDTRYRDAAVRAVSAVLKWMQDDDGRLLRTMRGHKAKIPAFLEDYAFVVAGLIEVYQATNDKRWLEEAQRLTSVATGLFDATEERGGGYFDTLAEQDDLFVRLRGVYDGAVPSGNAQMIHNRVSLFELTGEQSYLDRAVMDLRSFARDLKRFGLGMAHMQHALLRVKRHGVELVGDDVAIKAGHDGGHDGGHGEGCVGETRGVVVSVSHERVVLGAEPVTVVVTMALADEYHINGHGVDEDFLVPTTVTLADGRGVSMSVDYPDAVERRYQFADRALQVYEGEVRIAVTLSRLDVAANDKSDGGNDDGEKVGGLVLTYQACTATSCLSAKRVVLPVRIVFE